MTTDTVAKAVSRRIGIGDRSDADRYPKGAGMIRPNMATMLGYLATDAGIGSHCLRNWFCEAADESVQLHHRRR